MSTRLNFSPVKAIEIPQATYRIRAISTEAMSYYHPNMAIISKLSDTYEGMMVTLSKQMAKISAIPAAFKTSKVEKVIATAPYTELMDLKLPCINGQVCDWGTAIDLLEMHENLIAEMPERVFNPFMKFVGTALNDPSKLDSVNFRSALRATDMSDLRSRYSKLFGGTRDTSTFGKLCRRNTDWSIAHTRMRQLIDNSKVPEPKEVERQVKDINEVLNKLFRAIKDPSKDYRPTGTVINEFAKLIEALAEEVTLYALYMNYLNQASKAFKDSEDLILKYT